MVVKFIERVAAVYPGYQWTKNETSPWTPLTKPVNQCKVALISSGGVHLKNQPPFDVAGKGEAVFREIPKNVQVKDLTISHQAYNHNDADKDVNCIFPIERFRELEQEGFIGTLADTHFTFMGRVFSRTALQKQMAPQLARRLHDMSVDLFYMVPA